MEKQIVNLLRIYDEFIGSVRYQTVRVARIDTIMESLQKLCAIADEKREIFAKVIGLAKNIELEKNEHGQEPVMIAFSAVRNESSTDSLYALDNKGVPYCWKIGRAHV